MIWQRKDNGIFGFATTDNRINILCYYGSNIELLAGSSKTKPVSISPSFACFALFEHYFCSQTVDGPRYNVILHIAYYPFCQLAPCARESTSHIALPACVSCQLSSAVSALFAFFCIVLNLLRNLCVCTRFVLALH